MATFPLCALASGARRISRRSAGGFSDENTAARQRITANTALLSSIQDPSRSCRSRHVLVPHLVEEALAVGGDFPGVGPETQVDAPPIIGDAGPVQRGQELIKVQ